MKRALVLSMFVTLALPLALSAQDDLMGGLGIPDGEEATADETEAFLLVQQDRLVKAREMAERIVLAHPRSYVGHFVLGFVHHYAEANLPRALYHMNLALRLFEEQHGQDPVDGPWRWHARILREIGAVHGDLEHHEERLAYAERYSKLYEPDMIAERAWSLMKLGRHDEARIAAGAGASTGDPRQIEVALNALCAIEFEVGNDGASYEACQRALEYGRTQSAGPSSVDLTNFAEAARSLFKLDEAENIGLEATRVPVSWYGSPWLELAELYTREGRFPEALHALQEVPPYRAQRPPHVRDADRNESRRALAAFFLAIGRVDDALAITEKALVSPDRRAHNSRDPAQDLALTALLDRRARLVRAETLAELSPTVPFYERPALLLERLGLRFEAWRSGREVAKLMSNEDKLVGFFRIGTARAAIVPPWLAGEMVEVLGAGVVRAAIHEAAASERRPGGSAYMDAFEAEAALAEGENEEAARLAKSALAVLNPAEVLLRARTQAVCAEALYREEKVDEAAAFYEDALTSDPGVFRRMGLTIPVSFPAEVSGDRSEEVLDLLESSPRFEEAGGLFAITIADDRTCLAGPSGTIIGCAEVAELPEDDEEAAKAIAIAFHEAVFAPRIDLSQADANSLDGSNRVSRDPLESLGSPGN